MAAGVLSEPGTQYGPCIEDCKHVDCAATRRHAAVICPDCHKPIGYGNRFYRDQEEGEEADWTRLVHMMCYLERDRAG